jgi:hypothetical protein
MVTMVTKASFSSMEKKEGESDRSRTTIPDTNGPQGRSHLTTLLLWQLPDRQPYLIE